MRNLRRILMNNSLKKIKIYLDTSVLSYLKQEDSPEKMTKPEISKDFTIDDIHKIREYNWEQTKTLSVSEQIEYYRTKARNFLNEAGIIPDEINNNSVKNKEII